MISRDYLLRAVLSPPGRVRNQTYKVLPATLRQLVEAVAEAFEAHGEADALLGRLEDDEGRGLAGAQLLEQIVVHHHLGHAAVGQAAHEPGAAHIDLVD